MKTHKYFLIGVMAISSLALSSCLKDQEDVFDGNASERMQTYLRTDGRLTIILTGIKVTEDSLTQSSSQVLLQPFLLPCFLGCQKPACTR